MDEGSNIKLPVSEAEALAKKTAAPNSNRCSPIYHKLDPGFQSGYKIPKRSDRFVLDCTRLISLALFNSEAEKATRVSIYEFICKYFVNFGDEFGSRHTMYCCLNRDFSPVKPNPQVDAQPDEVLWTWRDDTHRNSLMIDIVRVVSQNYNHERLMLKNFSDMNVVFRFMKQLGGPADVQSRASTESACGFPTPHSTPIHSSFFEPSSQRMMAHGAVHVPTNQYQQNANVHAHSTQHHQYSNLYAPSTQHQPTANVHAHSTQHRPNSNFPYRFPTPPNSHDFSSFVPGNNSMPMHGSNMGYQTMRPAQMSHMEHIPSFRGLNPSLPVDSNMIHTNNRATVDFRVPPPNMKRPWRDDNNFQSSSTKYSIGAAPIVYVIDIGHKCVATELPDVLPQFTADEVDCILNSLN